MNYLMSIKQISFGGKVMYRAKQKLGDHLELKIFVTSLSNLVDVVINLISLEVRRGYGELIKDVVMWSKYCAMPHCLIIQPNECQRRDNNINFEKDPNFLSLDLSSLSPLSKALHTSSKVAPLIVVSQECAWLLTTLATSKKNH